MLLLRFRDNRKTIIGTPALKSNTIIIDIAGNNIKQGDLVQSLEAQNRTQISISEINLKISPTRPPPPLQMHSTTEIIVPKRSTKFIKISSRHPVEKPAYFSTLDAFDHNMESGILVGKSLSILTPDKPNCILRLCNVNDHDVTIKPLRRIINLYAVETKEDGEIPTSINQLETAGHKTKFDQVIMDVKIGTKNKDSISAVHKLIAENLDAFAIDNEPLGQTDKAVYDINTGNSPPVAQARYRTPYYLRDEMKKIIDKNVASGLMEPCSSPYAAPVLLVKKQNGSWRLVCDYRKLNNVTVSDCYPLPAIDDLVTHLSSSKVFSGADLWTGFHQIPCSLDAKQKLAITTDFGQFTWLSMPMGGKNAPSVFQRLMDNVFQSIPQDELVIYLDDLLVHSITEEQNIIQLRRVLQILIANNLKIRATKTEFLMSEINFCGYILSNGSRKPNPKKVEAVQNLNPPRSRTEAQSVFGLLNYHRYFIPNFAQKAAPITSTYKGHFNWTPEAQKALDILKIEISNTALALKIPDVNKAAFVLETDASKDGYGACLFICATKGSHTHGSKCLRPVEYASRQFDQAQRNYSTLEKELLAGREALRKWSHFLLGRKFVWRTDNTCLQWAHKVRSRILKVSQWLAEISEYDMIIERRPSSTMKISDCLSRNFAELNSLHVTKTDMRDLQSNDEVLERVRHYNSIGRWPHNQSPEIQPYFNRRSDLIFGTSGELLLQSTTGLRTLPTKALTEDIIKAYHDKNGHPGAKQTIDQLERNYFWPTLASDVKQYIQTCHKCQVTKPNLHPKQPPQGLSETPTGPWQMISWDLIGPLPITDLNYKHILTGFDLFSKRVYAVSLKSKNSDIIANSIRRILLQNPQLPMSILTDNGAEFDNTNLSRVCRDFKITHKMGPAYHPETNGGCERANQTLKNRLFCDDMETWDERLDQTVHTINCSKHAVTGLSPFAIETGNPGRNIQDFVIHSHNPQQNNTQHIQQTRRKIIEEKQVRFNKFDNERFEPFNMGDIVLAKNMVSKFPRFLGPLKIIEIRGRGLSYLVKDLQTGRQYSRAVRQLKLYHGRPNQPENIQPQSQFSDQPSQFNVSQSVEAVDSPSINQITKSQSEIPREIQKTKLPFEDDQWDIFRFTIPSKSDTYNGQDRQQNFPIADELDETFQGTSITSVLNNDLTGSLSHENDANSNSTETDSVSSSHTEHTLKITEFTKDQLLELAKIHTIETNGVKFDQINQIDSWFRENFPDHPRSPRGILIFQTNYTPIKDMTLKELKRRLLLDLMDDYEIQKPIFYKKTEELRKIIKRYIDKNLPHHPKNATGLYLFTKNEHEASGAINDNSKKALLDEPTD